MAWQATKSIRPLKVPFDFVYLFPLGKRGYARCPERWKRFERKPLTIRAGVVATAMIVRKI